MQISNIYLAYVKRFLLDSHGGAIQGSAIQILAGASFDEQEILEWIDEGKKVDHDIWYEEVPIENLPHSFSSPSEVLVYFDGCSFNEGWEHDFQWTDPVGRRALIPEKFNGVVRPQPETEGVQREDGYVGNDYYLWRVPCPWKSRYLLAPFQEKSNEDIDYGRPFTV